ncbi:MAG: hypothetical protein PHX38_08460 [Sulfuricella sp.]|nr:hypothetical protein [Sulfuricella sp.]
MPLTLTVPAIDPVEDLTVEKRPRHLQEWLNALPLTNLPVASGSLSYEIGALNRQKVAMETRLKLLELYRGAILKLLPALEEQFVATRLPLPEKNRELADLSRQLLTELATGYKIILLDYQGTRITLGKGKIIQFAAQRAMSMLGRILAICYQIYAPAPAGVWFEIHQIFRFAIEQGIANETVSDENGESSIGLVYKQILLLALSNPYHLNPGEVERVLGYLPRFGNLAQFQPFLQAGNSAGLFLVQTSGDSPPKNVPQNVGEVDNRNDILLNTQAVFQALHQHAERLEAEQPSGAQHTPEAAKESSHRDLLQRLLKLWSAAPKRVYHRSQNISSTEVCVGLPAIHHFLGGKKPAGEDADAPPVQLGRETRFVSGKWLIVNESAGGLALRGVFDTLPQIRPGEVIGLKAEGGGDWNIGVVRWVQSDKPNELEIGGQLMAPKAVPASIKPTIAGAAETFQAALLLPEILLLKQPETLVAPRGTFGPQRELQLELGDGTTLIVRAVRLTEQTSSIERFEFSRG